MAKKKKKKPALPPATIRETDITGDTIGEALQDESYRQWVDNYALRISEEREARERQNLNNAYWTYPNISTGIAYPTSFPIETEASEPVREYEVSSVNINDDIITRDELAVSADNTFINAFRSIFADYKYNTKPEKFELAKPKRNHLPDWF